MLTHHRFQGIVCTCMLSRFSCVQLMWPIDVACHILCLSAPLSVEFSRIRRIHLLKNTGVGCHALLQGIFPTQGLNSSLLCLMLGRQVLGGSDSTESAFNAGDPGSTPGSGRSLREGNGNPLQYSCPENPMNRVAWQAIVHGVIMGS